MEVLFVYGTLMKKCSRNEWSAFLQKNARYLGEATVKGDLYKVDYYPGLVKSENLVHGELYAFEDSSYVFHYLDQYEDYDSANPEESLYRREKSEVTLKESSETKNAWVYYYNRPTGHLEKYPEGLFKED
ncbi:gamma-glutamylcyclotransferase [Jiulongibacter sediminis]|uniref:gamma-glutamylcyclotransferase family protein n=1 Tax=Jiulongibacter sediminis TaxID=1605367 RepID=UPI0026ED732E|nr:gamma-glutamylcyclotransferase [Jiulongibacter sediminis]